MSKYAFVTAGSENYLPGLKAFFNSLVMHGHREDVLLLSFRLPEDFLEWLGTLPFKVKITRSQGEDQVQDTAIERFKFAFEQGQDYDALCLVEADIFLTYNCAVFFEVAAAGFVVTASNGMVVNFNRGYQAQYGIDLGVDDYIYPNVHTTVPIFLGKRDLDWFGDFHAMRMNARSFDDVFGLNVLGIKKGIDKRMICMPPYQFTGIHHFGVKPETGWMEKEGLLLSGTEQHVYMIHGKIFDKGWYQDLMPTMDRYFRDHDMGPWCRRRAIDACQTIANRFVNAYDLNSEPAALQKFPWLGPGGMIRPQE